jgi:hypothetical protein
MRRFGITAARIRRCAITVLLFGLAGAATLGVTKLTSSQNAEALPFAPARRGDFSAIVRCRGELKAHQ